MWKPLVLILIIIVVGVIGYHLIEGWNVYDSFYMTVITIFTVGFKEVKDLTAGGRLFTIFIILGGVGTAVYAFTKFGEIVYEGGIQRLLRRKRMENKLKKLKDHYIICGHGKIGKTVCERLMEEKIPFVIVEKDATEIEKFIESCEVPYILGDATYEEILKKAGIKKAKGLAALLPSDADNLYLVMTARMINPKIFVLSKANDEEAEKKIIQIGANRVVSPYKLSGLKIAQGLLRPSLVEFMDLIIKRKEISLSMEEIVVRQSASITGRNISECDIRKKADIIVVAIKKPGENIVFNPNPESRIESGDTLLVLGKLEDINEFEKIYINS
jgi:voltage-gated potassium channel